MCFGYVLFPALHGLEAQAFEYEILEQFFRWRAPRLALLVVACSRRCLILGDWRIRNDGGRQLGRNIAAMGPRLAWHIQVPRKWHLLDAIGSLQRRLCFWLETLPTHLYAEQLRAQRLDILLSENTT